MGLCLLYDQRKRRRAFSGEDRELELAVKEVNYLIDHGRELRPEELQRRRFNLSTYWETRMERKG